MARRGHKGHPRQPGLQSSLQVEPEGADAVAQVAVPPTIRVAPVVEVEAEPSGGEVEETAAPETAAHARRAAAPFPAPPPPEEPQPSVVAPTSANVAVVVTAPRALARSTGSEAGGFPPGMALDARLVLLREPDSQRAAAFRVLRHRMAERNDPRVVAVASALPGEGKTQCAVNLALASAEAARGRVLLVEANLRAPALATIFGALPALDPMAARLPAWPLPAPWSVFKRFSPWLDVVAAEPGQAAGGPLDGASWGRLMDVLRGGGYDRLVIDGPAVLGSADVNLIEDYVDAVLLVAWSRRSSARTLRRAAEQLEPVKLAGITLLDA
jgi:Mrp family chromosome partitioning ATPase